MNDKEIIRAAMETRGFSQAYLAEKAGYASQAGVSQLLSSKKGMRVDNFVKLLSECDFEVIVRSRTKSGEEWKVEM